MNQGDPKSGLSSPLPVGRMTLRNRVVMPPMANNLADELGEVPERPLSHFR